MSRHTLPKPGTRARSVLDVLFANPTVPMEESVLMALHPLPAQSPGAWRHEVYRPLQDAYLIVCYGGGHHDTTSWALTGKGLRLLRAEQAAVLVPPLTQQQTDARMAQPRHARVFHPMPIGSLTIRVMREGAQDYKTIPSMMGGRRCV